MHREQTGNGGRHARRPLMGSKWLAPECEPSRQLGSEQESPSSLRNPAHDQFMTSSNPPRMASHVPSPRRLESVGSYRRETRAIAALAVIALVAGVVSTTLATHFWGRHALLAGLASSAIVVMLSVALVSEALERRRRRRWTVLAQQVMIELVGNARLVWTVVMELADLMPSDAFTKASIDAGTRAVRDTPRLAEAIRQLGPGRRSRAGQVGRSRKPRPRSRGQGGLGWPRTPRTPCRSACAGRYRCRGDGVVDEHCCDGGGGGEGRGVEDSAAGRGTI